MSVSFPPSEKIVDVECRDGRKLRLTIPTSDLDLKVGDYIEIHGSCVSTALGKPQWQITAVL